MKKIINKIKRFYYRIINRDPLKKCTFHKEIGCSHVDGPLCDFPNCDIRLEHEGKDFVYCPNCVYFDDCCSSKFGLGCFKGKNIKIEKQI